MPQQNEISGMAALAICESLLLAMSDHKLLPESEIVGILKDAAATHENAAALGEDPETHRAVAALIRVIIAGEHSVRRS
ncbi:hypothetical protein [Stappia indica]|uniref:hypothetical protein n=1 Tax=Stappia indica TaxID=538381 RepID=UPI001CD78049|nr:hypothetical protein [Stappia indica]MCA1298776.1 hypothetical protein [Stappia indica]